MGENRESTEVALKQDLMSAMLIGDSDSDDVSDRKRADQQDLVARVSGMIDVALKRRAADSSAHLV